MEYVSFDRDDEVAYSRHSSSSGSWYYHIEDVPAVVEYLCMAGFVDPVVDPGSVISINLSIVDGMPVSFLDLVSPLRSRRGSDVVDHLTTLGPRPPPPIHDDTQKSIRHSGGAIIEVAYASLKGSYDKIADDIVAATVTADRDEALEWFSEKLRSRSDFLEGDPVAAVYLLDEWAEGCWHTLQTPPFEFSVASAMAAYSQASQGAGL